MHQYKVLRKSRNQCSSNPLMCNKIVTGLQQMGLKPQQTDGDRKSQIKSYNIKNLSTLQQFKGVISLLQCQATMKSIVYIYQSMQVAFFLVVCFLSAKENYSQQVSAASFEWLVNMSMCEQWSCLTSAVLMKELQTEKRALEGLG